MPTTQLQLRRGTTAQTAVFTGATGEVTVDTDKKTLIVHDGVTAGGSELASNTKLQFAYNKANTATILAQAAFDAANSGGGGGASTGDYTFSSNNITLISNKNAVLQVSDTSEPSNTSLTLSKDGSLSITKDSELNVEWDSVNQIFTVGGELVANTGLLGSVLVVGNTLTNIYSTSYTQLGLSILDNLYVSKSITAQGDVNSMSDESIKDNIETITDALEKTLLLRGVSYNKKGDGTKSIGVIAQEVEKIIPEVVHQDVGGLKSVSYGNIIGLLIEAIKEQQKQIDELKSRV